MNCFIHFVDMNFARRGRLGEIGMVKEEKSFCLLFGCIVYFELYYFSLLILLLNE